MTRYVKYIFLLVLPVLAQFDSSITVSAEKRITISVVGDIMAHQTQLNWAKLSDGSYDFNPVFRFVKKYIQASDFALANFETVCAGSKFEYTGYPVFNTPDTLIGTLKDAGFDLLLTANNHLLDMGAAAAKRTMHQISERGLFYCGSNLTPLEADSIRIYDVGGITFAFLAYSYLSNYGTGGNNGFILNKINIEKIKNDIKRARQFAPDLVIANFHFGTEEFREPDENQRVIVQEAIKAGADIILGGHPHRLQPIELFRTANASLDTGFVAYSMGNFLSNQRWRYNDAGAILNFTILKDQMTGSVRLEEITYIPTWVFKGGSDRGKEFIILPSEFALSETLPEFVSDKQKEQMLESYQDCIEIFQKYSEFPQIKNLFNIR